MKTLRKGFVLLIAAVALAAVSPAAAQEGEEELVPPDNSAVNQYTETFPTAGGDKDVNKGGARKPSPGKVLGGRNAQRLEQHGKAGREAARLAAETAPQVDDAPAADAGNEESDAAAAVGSRNEGGSGGAGNRSDPSPADDGGAGKGERGTGPADPADTRLVNAPDVEGSSGFSEVLAQATGSTSSGQMGLFLPLLIVATLIWAIAFAMRRTREDPR